MNRHVYLVGTPADAVGFCSFARRTDEARKITAYSNARAATLAATSDDLFVPGFLVGGDDPAPLSSLPVPELAARIKALAIESFEVAPYEWQGKHELNMRVRGSRMRVFHDVPAALLRKLLALFDRRCDPARIGELAVHRIEISE